MGPDRCAPQRWKFFLPRDNLAARCCISPAAPRDRRPGRASISELGILRPPQRQFPILWGRPGNNMQQFEGSFCGGTRGRDSALADTPRLVMFVPHGPWVLVPFLVHDQRRSGGPQNGKLRGYRFESRRMLAASSCCCSYTLPDSNSVRGERGPARRCITH